MATPNNLIVILTVIAALGSGLIAGVFFAFSTFVMKALARIQPSEGIAAMQSINIVVVNPLFLTAFMGTAAICVVVTVLSILRWSEAGSAWLLAGAAVYVIGTFLVTVVFNIPLNNVLAAVDPASADGARLWAGYVSDWTFWNHVRTIAAFSAATLLTLALIYRAAQT